MSVFRLSFALPVLALACNAAAASAESGRIDLTPAQIERLQIGTADVSTAKLETVALLPAQVIPPKSGRLIVAAPFAGTVEQVSVLPGQKVKKGDRLARVMSRELIETWAQLRRAEAELMLAEAELKKKAWLAQKKIDGPGLQDIAQAKVRMNQATVEEHRRMLDRKSVVFDKDGSFTLLAPETGTVAVADISPGKHIEAMGAALTIDTSHELWIEAQLPGRLIGAVRPGDSIHLDNGGSGTVISVGNVLDPITRSAILLARLPADAGLVAGQLTTISITRETAPDSLGVPASSLSYIDGKPVVFVRKREGFDVIEVTVRGKSLHEATVAGELTAGEQVAVSGLTYLEQMLAGE